MCALLPKQATDRSAASRLEALDRSLAELKKEQAELNKQWEREREDMRRLQSIKVRRVPPDNGPSLLSASWCSGVSILGS